MVEMKKLTVDQRRWIGKWVDEHTLELGITNYPYVSVTDLKDFLDTNTEGEELPTLMSLKGVIPKQEDKPADIPMYPSIGQRAAILKDCDCAECKARRERKDNWVAQPDGIPVENSKYPYAHEDWAGINPMYDPYADVELGRVDRYFEDEQGIVDTVVIK